MTTRYTEAQKRATLAYHAKNRIQKPIEFNRSNDDDMELWNWCQKQGLWQPYIKGLIKADMEARKERS